MSTPSMSHKSVLVIDEMVEKGAEVNAEEKQAMIDWLVARD